MNTFCRSSPKGHLVTELQAFVKMREWINKEYLVSSSIRSTCNHYIIKNSKLFLDLFVAFQNKYVLNVY